MITAKTKAYALSLLKMGDSIKQVSEDLQLPIMLVREWAETIDIKDLTELNANAVAVSRVLEGEVLNSNEDIEKLKNKIEKTALLIIDKVGETIAYPDLPQAKALELLANTCSKLYMTIVSRSNLADSGPINGLTLLEQLGRD